MTFRETALLYWFTYLVVSYVWYGQESDMILPTPYQEKRSWLMISKNQTKAPSPFAIQPIQRVS